MEAVLTPDKKCTTHPVITPLPRAFDPNPKVTQFTQCGHIDRRRVRAHSNNLRPERKLTLAKMPPNEAPITATYISSSRRQTVAAVPEGQIRVEDKLYSTEKLAELHPGGPLFVKVDNQNSGRCRHARHLINELSPFQIFSGRDASQAFISYHRRNFPHNRAKAAFEGIDESVDYTPEDHADYMELCDRVGKVLPNLKSFAPWYYYIKVAFLVGSIVAFEAYCHYNAYYGFPFNMLVGLFAALIGK